MKFKILLPFIFLLSSSTFSSAEISNFQPKFPQFSTDKKTRNSENQTYFLGNAIFKNNVSIPFYGVTALSPVEDGYIARVKKCDAKSCHFDFKLDAEAAKQLKLLSLPEIGVVLVPRHWQDFQSHAGANGTGSSLLMSPNHQEAITLYNSSVCAVCGYPSASLYFPQLLKQSIEYEYGGMQDRQKKLTLVYPNKNTAFFSYQIPKLNNKTHGIAKYLEEGDFNFQDIHVTLDQNHQHLVRPILNFYHATHEQLESAMKINQ